MSEWVSDSEIASRLGYKILLAGLSEAGKTATKRIFFLKQSTHDVKSLSATINYERMTVNLKETPITIVDLGGQKIFLKRFLSNFSPFVFSSVACLIFLIDVSNKTSRNNSIQYFAGCLEKLREFSPDAEIFVFLHKNDLVRNSPNYETIHSLLKEQFQVEYKKPLRFFRTTIYKPETVINAFGRIFEIVMPELAESELVENRTIGVVEEYSDSKMTLVREIEKPETAKMRPEFPTIDARGSAKEAGDPMVLDRLQKLMKVAVQKDETNLASLQADVSVPSIRQMASDETTTEQVLTHFVEEPESKPKRPIEDPISAPKIEYSSTIATMKPSDEQVNRKINHLINFYRITTEEATDIANSGYANIFELVTKSGVPVQVAINVINKYIPFIKTQGIDTKTLSHDKLLELFLAFLSGTLKEEQLMKALIFIIQRPKMSIIEIAEKYLKEEKIAPLKPKIKVEVPSEVKTPSKPKIKVSDYVEFPVPLKPEELRGIIRIPDTDGLGFNTDLIEDGNANITFFKQGNVVARTLVSSTISINELMYLLGYELSFEPLGVFEGGQISLKFAARIIHEALRQLRRGNISTASQVTSSAAARLKEDLYQKRKSILPKPVKKTDPLITPLVQKTAEGFSLIPDTDEIAFSIERKGNKVRLTFLQRGYQIGLTWIDKDISINDLKEVLTNKLFLPIESQNTIDFAARMIFNDLNPISASKPVTEKLSIKEEEIEDSSELLRKYLDLLTD